MGGNAPIKTLTEIQALSDTIANHLRIAVVEGFTTAEALTTEGSAAVTGLSPASDAPIQCVYFAFTAANSGMVSQGSVAFISGTNRFAIRDVNTTGKTVQLFWWDKKP